MYEIDCLLIVHQRMRKLWNGSGASKLRRRPIQTESAPANNRSAAYSDRRMTALLGVQALSDEFVNATSSVSDEIIA